MSSTSCVKGRHPLTALSVNIRGRPRRTSIRIAFFASNCISSVRGDVPAAAVERAIALSRDKYCSVWHSMRQDIELTTTFEVVP